MMTFPTRILMALGLAASVPASKAGVAPVVQLVRVPDAGIQPQTAVAADGSVHLVYFKGEPGAGDLFYKRSADGRNFGPAIRVNSVPGTAVALGNIRGARIALGRDDRVLVTWNGSERASDGNANHAPMLFARLNETGTAFEPERNLIHTAFGVDGGGGIAADRRGHVYVFWHAPLPGSSGEAMRRVWMARSSDNGESFAPERIVGGEATGACGCCSLNAFAGGSGHIDVLYRSATDVVHRDMYLLHSTDGGGTFTNSRVSPWNVSYCVMSSEAFAGNAKLMLAAWETEKQVLVGRVDARSGEVVAQGVTAVGVNEKYPALALDREGNYLVAWTEGMGWKRGGTLHWRMVNGSGQTLGAPGQANGVPVWSTVAAYVRRDGSFAVVY